MLTLKAILIAITGIITLTKAIPAPLQVEISINGVPNNNDRSDVITNVLTSSTVIPSGLETYDPSCLLLRSPFKVSCEPGFHSVSYTTRAGHIFWTCCTGEEGEKDATEELSETFTLADPDKPDNTTLVCYGISFPIPLACEEGEISKHFWYDFLPIWTCCAIVPLEPEEPDPEYPEPEPGYPDPETPNPEDPEPDPKEPKEPRPPPGLVCSEYTDIRQPCPTDSTTLYNQKLDLWSCCAKTDDEAEDAIITGLQKIETQKMLSESGEARGEGARSKKGCKGKRRKSRLRGGWLV